MAAISPTGLAYKVGFRPASKTFLTCLIAIPRRIVCGAVHEPPGLSPHSVEFFQTSDPIGILEVLAEKLHAIDHGPHFDASPIRAIASEKSSRTICKSGKLAQQMTWRETLGPEPSSKTQTYRWRPKHELICKTLAKKSVSPRALFQNAVFFPLASIRHQTEINGARDVGICHVRVYFWLRLARRSRFPIRVKLLA